MMPIQSPKAAGALPEPVPIPAYDLAKAIAAAPNNATIQLPVGLFRIICDGVYNRWDKTLNIFGSGPGTIIQRDPFTPVANNQPVLYGVGDDNQVCNLTVDSGGSDTDDYVHSCLRIDGDRSIVRNVRGINASGKWVDDEAFRLECFAFFINGADGIMEDCWLSQVKGYKTILPSDVAIHPPRGYVEGFCSGGLVENCFVDYPAVPNNAHPPFFNGFQASGSNGARFLNCTQRGGNSFFYSDTGSDTHLTIAGCRAFNVLQGIIIQREAGEKIDDLDIHHNVIELSTAATWQSGCNLIAVSGPGAAYNVRAHRNFGRYVGGARGSAGNVGRLIGIGVTTATSSGTVITNNQMDQDFDMTQHEEGAVVSLNTYCARSASTPLP